MTDHADQLAHPPSLDLSVIIVSFNTKALVIDCLESLYTYTGGISFEVFVVDNASGDGSAEAVAERFPGVILIKNATNRGFSAANNQGIRESRGRYVVLLNSDTRLIENCFPKVIRYLDDHPEFSVCTPKVVDEDFKPASMRILEDTPMDAFWRILGKYDEDREAKMMGKDEPKEVESIGGPCFFIRRTLLETIGLLDENYFLYNEEDDFCRRARQQGYKICYYPETSLIHLRGKSTNLLEIRERVIIETYKSNLYFYTKYYSVGWNLALRFLYRFTFILGIFKSAWLRIVGKAPATADNSISLKLKLLFMKTPKIGGR